MKCKCIIRLEIIRLPQFLCQLKLAYELFVKSIPDEAINYSHDARTQELQLMKFLIDEIVRVINSDFKR